MVSRLQVLMSQNIFVSVQATIRISIFSCQSIFKGHACPERGERGMIAARAEQVGFAVLQYSLKNYFQSMLTLKIIWLWARPIQLKPQVNSLNLLVSNRYYCTYILVLFLRSICLQKLTLTLLNHKSPKPTIEINHFLYKLNH